MDVQRTVYPFISLILNSVRKIFGIGCAFLFHPMPQTFSGDAPINRDEVQHYKKIRGCQHVP